MGMHERDMGKQNKSTRPIYINSFTSSDPGYYKFLPIAMYYYN